MELTQHEKTEAFLNGQNRVLELVATGAPLRESLTALVRLIEANAPSMLGSVLLLDEECVHLHHGAAPSLPQEYMAAIDGVAIGPKVGSCGTAAYLKEAVFVEDIATHPFWSDYKAVALPHGLHACWSTPIFDAQRRVLGTFAMYYRQPALPLPDHLRLIGIATHIAAIAISHHRIEAALREKEHKLEEAERVAHVGYWEQDLNTGSVTLSGEAYRIFGLPPGERILDLAQWNRRWLPRIHPEDLLKATQAVADSARGGARCEVEYRVVRPGGGIRFVHSMAEVTKDESGRPYRWFGTIQDVTERKKAEEALRHAAEEIRDLYNHAPCGYHSLDKDGVFLRMNETELEWLGYRREEVVGKMKFTDLLTAEGVKTFATNFPRFKAAGAIWNLEFDLIRKNGSRMPVLLSATALTDKDGNYLMSRSTVYDITERKQAEEALHRLNRELRGISNCNQTLMRAVDEKILLDDICRIVCENVGYRMAWVGYVENDSAKTVRPAAWAGSADGFLANANITWADTERGLGLAGTAIQTGATATIQDISTSPQFALWRESALQSGYRSVIALPLKDERGRVFGIFLIYSTEINAFTPDEIRILEELAGDLAFGVTVLRGRNDQKQAEEALRRSEDFLDKIIENIPNLLFVKEVKTLRFIRFNKAGEQLLGYSREEMIGKNVYDIWPKQQADFFTLKDREMLQKKELLEVPEEPVQTKDRGERIFHTTKLPVLDQTGTPLFLLGISEDITERKRLQARENMRSSVLEKLIRGDALQDILESLILGIEEEQKHMIGSILLLDKEGRHLQHGAGPSLPQFYNDAIHGVEIGQEAGSCGTSAYTGKQLIVEDIQTHPYWTLYREVAGQAGLAACWSQPIFNRQGQVIGTFAIYHREPCAPTRDDIDLIQSVANLAGVVIEHKQVEEEIRQLNAELEQRVEDRTRELAKSEECMRMFFERQLVGMAITTPEKGWLQVNDKLCQMLGYSRQELARLTWAELTYPEDLAPDLAQFERLQHGEIDSYTLEKRFVRKDGNLVFTNLSVGCVRRPDRSLDYVLALLEDITQRKRAERKAEEALEKEVILRREIHHRVKNNLQVVISLLYLQSLKAGDPNSMALLRESQARVHSIALVHEMLYQREDLTKISFNDYVQQLAADLFVTYRINQRNIVQKIGPEGVFLGLDTAIPCGIIITELVTNALKYAFPGGAKGEIEISLLPVATTGTLALTVRDNGVGLPKDLDVKLTQTMGLSLVRDLTRQLGGTVEFRDAGCGHGTEVQITFPEPALSS